MELTFEEVGPDLRISGFTRLSPPYLSLWTIILDVELIDPVIRFVVTVFPTIVSVFAAVKLTYNLFPIDNVSLGATLDIPDVSVPVVRKPFTFTLLLKVATV